MSKEQDIHRTDEPQSPARRQFMKYAGASALYAMTSVDNVVADSNTANKLITEECRKKTSPPTEEEIRDAKKARKVLKGSLVVIGILAVPAIVEDIIRYRRLREEERIIKENIRWLKSLPRPTNK